MKPSTIIVNKFGGSIMGPKEFVLLASHRTKEQRTRGAVPIVVVSALQGITDQLVKLGEAYDERIIESILDAHLTLIDTLSIADGELIYTIENMARSLSRDAKVLKGKMKANIFDRVLSYGERMSALIFAHLLRIDGLQSVPMAGEEIGVLTDDTFGDAHILYKESVRAIRKSLKKYTRQSSTIPVITGFIGKTSDGHTTTLGRGGSDTTACLIGAALQVSKVILWKDVPGVLSSDPKIVGDAVTVPCLDYAEAEESGKVIHDKAMRIIRQTGTIVEVRDIRDQKKKTVVSRDGASKLGVKIVSHKRDLTLLVIRGEKIQRAGALAEIADIIRLHGINMTLIRNTRDSLYIVIEKNSHPVHEAVSEIQRLAYEVTFEDVSQVNVIGKLGWHVVERFNHILHTHFKEAEIGAFPYKDCVRLEAIVPGSAVKKIVNMFHREFIQRR